MENENYESNLTERVQLCPDGKYRWNYELNLRKNLSVFIDLLKAFFIPLLFIVVIGIFAGIHNYGFEWAALVKEAKGFFWISVFVFFLCFISYLIVIRINRGYNHLMFIMDEEGITHCQRATTAKRGRRIGLFAAMVDTDNIPAAMAASQTMWSTQFQNVRKVKIKRRRNLIKVNAILIKNRVYVENPEDYEFVLRYITERCPKLKQNKQNNKPKNITT